MRNYLEYQVCRTPANGCFENLLYIKLITIYFFRIAIALLWKPLGSLIFCLIYTSFPKLKLCYGNNASFQAKFIFCNQLFFSEFEASFSNCNCYLNSKLGFENWSFVSGVKALFIFLFKLKAFFQKFKLWFLNWNLVSEIKTSFPKSTFHFRNPSFVSNFL